MHDEEAPSKSARKRAMQALQKYAEELSELPQASIAQLDLPETLRDALLETQRIRAHEARRRHFQYLGKLMRQADLDEGAVQDLIKQHHSARLDQNRRFKLTEKWREQILAGDETALQQLWDKLPQGQTCKSVMAEIVAARDKQPGAGKRLFRLLYACMD